MGDKGGKDGITENITDHKVSERVLQNIQEFVNGKEKQEHFSQCGSKKKNEEQSAQKQEDMIKHHVFRKPIVL